MPRPKTFDPDETIQAAMMVFWKKGYEGTSYEDLVKETGVNRTSLYNSFGDKRAMFLKVLDVYHTTIKTDLLKEISKPNSGLKDLIGFLERIIQMFQYPSEEPKGCLFCNAHNELMPSDDADINAKMTVLLDQPRQAFRHVLTNAKIKKELSKSANIEELSDMMTTFMMGLSAVSKSTLSQTVAVNALKGILKTLQSQ